VAASRTLAGLARWSLVGVVVLMVAGLIATVWSTYRSVNAASDALVRDQIRRTQRSLRRLARQNRPLLSAEVMAEFLETHREDGLRYVAIIRDGSIEVEAGQAAGRGTEPTRGQERVEGRIRVVIDGSRLGRRPNRPRRRRFGIALELEPTTADELSVQARRSLQLSAIVGAILIIFAIVLVRWYLRAEARERELEHKRRLASLGQMSAVLAHEIRNPVASLKGNAQLLVKLLPDDGKPRTKAERVVDEAARLEALTNDLLDFAKAGEISRKSVTPSDLVRSVIAEAGYERVAFDDAAAPTKWSLDEAKIRQALANLIDNACQASDGEVRVALAQEAGRLVFTVRDNGEGISAADLERIFDPFYTRKTRGTGLGLAIVRRMVELHGGSISAHNATGGGAEFRIEIPRA